MTHFFGIDETHFYMPQGERTRPDVFLLYSSTDNQDVIPSNQPLIRDRTLNIRLLDSQFLYAIQWYNISVNRHFRIISVLIQEAKKRFCCTDEAIELYLSRLVLNISPEVITRIREAELNENTTIDIKNDTEIPLLNKADNLTGIVSWVHSESTKPNIQERMKRLIKLCPDLEQKVKPNLVRL